MENISEDALDNFQTITSYDARQFFADYVIFIEQHYSDISNYFSGISNTMPTEAFQSLDDLQIEYNKLIDVTVLNAELLEDYQYWVILENVEDIGHTLETANKMSKWLRSALTKDGYKQQVVIDYMAEQGQNLEDIERRKIRSTDFSNTWADTAIQNQLREEDYDLNGGYLIKVIYKNNNTLFLNSVVDNIDTPQKTYGLDVKRQITFVDDDLEVLSYQDTLLQSAQILTDLNVGDDPSFPDRGKDIKNILGGSFAAISYPTIFRQLANNFATDDSFKAFGIVDVRKDQDAIYVDFNIQTKADEVLPLSSQIQ